MNTVPSQHACRLFCRHATLCLGIVQWRACLGGQEQPSQTSGPGGCCTGRSCRAAWRPLHWMGCRCRQVRCALLQRCFMPDRTCPSLRAPRTYRMGIAGRKRPAMSIASQHMRASAIRRPCAFGVQFACLAPWSTVPDMQGPFSRRCSSTCPCPWLLRGASPEHLQTSRASSRTPPPPCGLPEPPC